ncbi:hypothetical protein C8Q74DRAFT_1305206 [Fomes fomentarius]|nr:hypothetical protein C8Q74DRAFT_1305206 [Fomes fomentarius]
MSDLPKLVELKKNYKCRLILNESISFGSVGRTSRSLPELYNVPACKVDMSVGSVATGLASCDGFYAGVNVVVNRQVMRPSHLTSGYRLRTVPRASTVASICLRPILTSI